MTKNLIALLGILVCLPAMGVAPAATHATTDGGPTKGQLRAEWVPSSAPGPNSLDGVASGELRIYRTKDKSLLQRIPTEVFTPMANGAVQFWDMNADGFQDIEFVNNGGPYGIASSDVYLWIPSLKRFVKSETLSGIGELSKTKEGCVQVQHKCSSSTWNATVYCFNNKIGRWHIASDDGCIGPDPDE